MSRIDTASTPQRLVSGANAAATITLPAEAKQHRLTMITASYSGAAGLPSVTAPGRVTVTDGATTVFEWDVVGPGSYTVPLPPGGIVGSTNQAMVVTLTAGGAAVVGRLSVAAAV